MGNLGWCMAVALATVGPSPGPRVDLGDLSLEIGERWKVVDHAKVRDELAGRSDSEGRADVLRVWAAPAVGGGSFPARIVVSRRPCALRFGSASRREIERWLRQSRGAVGASSDLEVVDIRPVEVDGVEVCRLRLRLRSPRGTVEQLLHVAGGAATRVIALSAPAARFDALVDEYEAVVDSIRWNDPGPAPGPSVAWLGVAMTGALAGAGRARWRRARADSLRS